MPPVKDRRQAREVTLQACYAFEMSGNKPTIVLDDIILNNAESQSISHFAKQLFLKTVEHWTEFDDLIKQRTENWEFSRIAIIDRLILRIALCEFLYFEDIPPNVSIDEAIEIAKNFSTENSGRFVNGILDALLSDLRESGRVHKTGRGLEGGH